MRERLESGSGDGGAGRIGTLRFLVAFVVAGVLATGYFWHLTRGLEGPPTPRAPAGSPLAGEVPAGEAATPPAPVPSPPEATRTSRPPPPPAPPSPALPLAVEARDARTGEWLGGADVSLVAADGTAVPLTAHGARFELTASPLRRGAPADVKLLVTPPRGYALARDPPLEYPGEISAFAGRVEIPVLLWPEADLAVRVVEENGDPVPGAEVTEVRVGGRPHTFSAPPADGTGQIRIDGIPSLTGEPILVTAELRSRRAVSPPATLGAAGAAVSLRVVLPWRSSRPPRRLVAERAWARTFVRPLVAEPTGGTTRGGRLRVRVRRRDGEPAAGIRVRVWVTGADRTLSEYARRTDAAGRLDLDGLPAGSATVTVADPAFRSPPAPSPTIRAGRTTEVEIEEAEAGPGYLLVVDPAGQPVPGARIEVAGSWACLVGDRQILAIYTDPAGRAVLPDLPITGVKVRARYGHRVVTARVAAGASATLTLPPD